MKIVRKPCVVTRSGSDCDDRPSLKFIEKILCFAIDFTTITDS
jgi:hypothetical protein